MFWSTPSAIQRPSSGLLRPYPQLQRTSTLCQLLGTPTTFRAIFRQCSFPAIRYVFKLINPKVLFQLIPTLFCHLCYIQILFYFFLSSMFPNLFFFFFCFCGYSPTPSPSINILGSPRSLPIRLRTSSPTTKPLLSGRRSSN